MAAKLIDGYFDGRIYSIQRVRGLMQRSHQEVWCKEIDTQELEFMLDQMPNQARSTAAESIEHSFRKFLGYCNDFDRNMRRCLKKERLKKVQRNYEQSLIRHAEIRKRILENTKQETQ